MLTSYIRNIYKQKRDQPKMTISDGQMCAIVSIPWDVAPVNLELARVATDSVWAVFDQGLEFTDPAPVSSEPALKATELTRVTSEMA